MGRESKATIRAIAVTPHTGLVPLHWRPKILRGVPNYRKENKGNDDAHATTTERVDKTHSGLEVNATPQLPTRLYSKKKLNTQRPWTARQSWRTR